MVRCPIHPAWAADLSPVRGRRTAQIASLSMRRSVETGQVHACKAAHGPYQLTGHLPEKNLFSKSVRPPQVQLVPSTNVPAL